MIYTITLTPAIEKRIRGSMKDDLLFEGENFSYNCAGVGLKVSKYLKHYKIENTATFISGSKAASFILKDLKDRNIEQIHIETNFKTPYHLLVIDENELCHELEKENQMVEDKHIKIFQSVLSSQMKKEDVSVFEYNQNDISYKTMYDFYHTLHEHSEVMICDIHPDYYGILKEKPANVLVVEEAQFLSYIKKEKNPLSETMNFIHKYFTKMAKIIVYALSVNDFLLFVEGKIYRVVCSLKNPNTKIYKEALLAGIVRCYQEDGDLNELCKQCITMSVGASLSDGLFLTNAETLAEITKNINIYSL